MADNINSIGTAISVLDLYRNAKFHGTCIQQTGQRIYIYYANDMVPNSFLFYITTYRSFNSYQNLLRAMWGTLPNYRSNGQYSVDIYNQNNSAHMTGYSDGTNGTLVYTDPSSTSDTATYAYTYYENYTSLSISLKNSGLYTGGSFVGQCSIVIPYY